MRKGEFVMIPIRVKRGSKIELIKAVRELEKRGFDYVTPIKAVYKTTRVPSRS